jgi:hypothetical protein
MEGPIGRYARASVDYTGIINVAYVLGACVANTISASGLCPRKTPDSENKPLFVSEPMCPARVAL